jgi:riboflavin biosynthesis pyrimidine reductase
MTLPPPLEVLYEASQGDEIALPPALRRLYGRLLMPLPASRPFVFSNYVQSIDGVVTLETGKSSGGPISGGNEHDRIIMGLLRSVADAVIVGAGTLRSVPRHIWTPQYICPDLGEEFAELRARLRKPKYPLNVIISGSGRLDPGFAILLQDEVPVLVVTTEQGATEVPSRRSTTEVIVASKGTELTPGAILQAVTTASKGRLLLLEAGPSLMGQFLSDRLVDELFLTVAPQIAGRENPEERPGLVSGRLFAPEDPLWSTLLAVRRAGSHLFLHYALPVRPGRSLLG